MKIGIVTFVNCGNYGAELQAFALQHKLNEMGYDAEVIDIEKEYLTSSDAVKGAIVSRLKYYGPIKGSWKVLQLIWSKYQAKKRKGFNPEKAKIKSDRYRAFWNECTKHSAKYYSLADLREATDLPWDILITGSDQVWNYRQTNYLDVYMLKFAKRLGKKANSYAASFGFSELPEDHKDEYANLLKDLDAISVRESNGLDIVRNCCNREATQVLDPTLLLNGKQWIEAVGVKDYVPEGKRFVIIYTITGSKYIYKLAKNIARQLNAEVINIKGDMSAINPNDGIIHIQDAGPREFVTLMSHAVYVITDSFHGTCFSINFNVPFTLLMNPVSKNNSRGISLLNMLKLQDRYMFEDGSRQHPVSLNVDFSTTNSILEEMREKSQSFITNNLQK